MFQRNKNSYIIIARCSNGDKESTYEFVEEYDEYWGEIAKELFLADFGIEPTSMTLVSREKA